MDYPIKRSRSELLTTEERVEELEQHAGTLVKHINRLIRRVDALEEKLQQRTDIGDIRVNPKREIL